MDIFEDVDVSKEEERYTRVKNAIIWMDSEELKKVEEFIKDFKTVKTLEV